MDFLNTKQIKMTLDFRSPVLVSGNKNSNR